MRAPAPTIAPAPLIAEAPVAPTPEAPVAAPPVEPPVEPNPLPEARSVAQAHAALRALPPPAPDCDVVPPAVVAAMRTMRVALNDYLVRALAADRCGAVGERVEAIAPCLVAGLRGAGVRMASEAGQDVRWGEVDTIRVEAVAGRPAWVIVTSSLTFDVSEDARVMLYQRGVGPRIVEAVATLTGLRDGHWHARAWAMVPAGGRGAPLLVVAHQDEWCMSRWRRRSLSVLAATRDPRRPRDAWSDVHGIDIGQVEDSENDTDTNPLSVTVGAGAVTLAWSAVWPEFVDRPTPGVRIHTSRTRVRLVQDAAGGVRVASRQRTERVGEEE